MKGNRSGSVFLGVSTLLLLCLSLVALARTPKVLAPPPPQNCQALADIYVDQGKQGDLQVVLPPGAVRISVELLVREDIVTSPWKQCTENQDCPIGAAGFSGCGVRGADPRDGAEKYGCAFGNSSGSLARRARLLVNFKHTKACCSWKDWANGTGASCAGRAGTLCAFVHLCGAASPVGSRGRSLPLVRTAGSTSPDTVLSKHL